MRLNIVPNIVHEAKCDEGPAADWRVGFDKFSWWF